MLKPNIKPSEFEDFLSALRVGDQDAALNILQKLAPQIRRVIRRRLAEGGLRRILDSVDIVQSVVVAFLEKAFVRQYEFKSSEDLFKFLVTIAMNKLRNKAGRERRRVQVAEMPIQSATSEIGPSDVVASRELVEQVRAIMTPEEMYLFRASKQEGRSWSELAAEIGVSADTLRMQLNRALKRVRLQLAGERDR